MSELSKGELSLVIPAVSTVTRSPSWQVEGTSLVSYPAPASLTYSVPQGEYTLTIVGNNAGTLPISPTYAFNLQVTAGGVAKTALISAANPVSTPVKVNIGLDNQLVILWTNDEYVPNKYDSNLRVVEIRLDPTEYDPTLVIVKKLTSATWTPLTDQEAQWLLGLGA